MAYTPKGVAEGVDIFTSNVNHTVRLEAVDEPYGQYRIIPPLKVGLAVRCGTSQSSAKWNKSPAADGDDIWEFIAVI
ncbi:hypothetical protein BGW39_004519 [Mortierella sp. 14UC]|nr:hypothetical protein BGW39_004519 [Mortierella sp. 14UC]